jgi:ketopantoate reductase
MSFNVLILGASYGSLLASKLLMAGHAVSLVCRPTNAELINREGIRTRITVKGLSALIEIDSRRLPGPLSAAGPHEVNPADFDLVVLAMKEPQYGAPDVRTLMRAIGATAVPCLSLMNIPPLPAHSGCAGR